MAQGVVKISAPSKPATKADKAMSRRHLRDSIKLARLSQRYNRQHARDHTKEEKKVAKVLEKHKKKLAKIASE